EQMLAEAEFELVDSSDGWGRFSRLSSRFDDLINACATECGNWIATRIVTVFERLMSIAAATKPVSHEEIYSYYTVLGSSFPAYVDALVQLGRQQDARNTIERLLPFWDEPDGHAALGRAAYKCDFVELAESLLSKIPHSFPTWWNYDELELLAKLWYQAGKPA